MNKDNAKDYLPLVQALADGKIIQIADNGSKVSWNDCSSPTFEFFPEYYRIKPEPIVAYVTVDPDVNANSSDRIGVMFADSSDAEKSAKRSYTFTKVIKMVQVDE